MASSEVKEVYVLKGQIQVDAFRSENPDGFTILDGDRGVGLTGDLAKLARNPGNNPENWKYVMAKVSAGIYESHR